MPLFINLIFIHSASVFCLTVLSKFGVFFTLKTQGPEESYSSRFLKRSPNAQKGVAKI